MACRRANVVLLSARAEPWGRLGVDVDGPESALFMLRIYQYMARSTSENFALGPLSYQRDFNPNAYFLYEVEKMSHAKVNMSCSNFSGEPIYDLDILSNSEIERLYAIASIFCVGAASEGKAIDKSRNFVRISLEACHPKNKETVKAWESEFERIIERWRAYLNSENCTRIVKQKFST